MDKTLKTKLSNKDNISKVTETKLIAYIFEYLSPILDKLIDIDNENNDEKEQKFRKKISKFKFYVNIMKEEIYDVHPKIELICNHVSKTGFKLHILRKYLITMYNDYLDNL